jgi:hypothetical protein
MLERKGFQVHQPTNTHGGPSEALPEFMRNKHLLVLPKQVLETGLVIFLIGAALMSNDVPVDIAVSALMLLFMILVLIIVPRLANMFLLRLVVFVSIGFAVYLSTSYPPAWLIQQNYLVFAYFAVLIIAGFMMTRLSLEKSFRVTPLDYLVIIIALFMAIVPEDSGTGAQLTWMTLQMIILFYASELILQRIGSVRNRLSGVIIAMLSLIAVRGLL